MEQKTRRTPASELALLAVCRVERLHPEERGKRAGLRPWGCFAPSGRDGMYSTIVSSEPLATFMQQFRLGFLAGDVFDGRRPTARGGLTDYQFIH